MSKVSVIIPSYGENFSKSARWYTKARSRCFRHPEYLLTAVAVLEKVGHDVQFIDATIKNLSKKMLVGKVLKFNSDMVVVYCTTPSIYSDIEHGSMIKKGNRKIRTVLIGSHVSALPRETMAIDKSIDVVAYSEYDYTLRDLASKKPLKKILGIAYRKGGRIIKNRPRPTIKSLDEMPFPAWRHINIEDYPDPGKLYPFITLLTGRGCPNNCTFCVNTPVMFKRKFRSRSAKSIVDEIEYDLKLFPNIKEFMFETDTFTANPEHVKEFCKELDRRKLKIKWSCNVRVDVDLSLLPVMKRHGCRMLMVGYESGNQRCLDSVCKRVSLRQSKRFTETAHRLGFIIHGCFMFGFPGETPEEAQRTIDFTKSLPLDTIQVSGIAAYPGTAIYEWAKRNKYLVPKDWTEWVSPEKEQVTVLSYPQFTKEQIDYYIDKALKEFYLRPNQMLRMVINIRNVSDIKRKLFGFKAFLDYFRGVHND
ncbi:MAG: radical SAM protein [Candidatus Aenigmatarchaeota archaeon]